MSKRKRPSSLGCMDRHPESLPTIKRDLLPAGLSSPALQEFVRQGTLLELSSGDVVFREGDIIDGVAILVSGRVKVLRAGEHGRENVLFVGSPGDLLGPLGLFGRALHSTSIVAIEPCEVACLDSEQWHAWLQHSSSAALEFIRLLVRRTQTQHDALHDVYGLDVATRLARVLSRDAHRFGRRTIEGTRVNLRLSQEELAQHVRASREHVNRVLARWVGQGIIRLEGTEVVILAETELHRLTRHDADVQQSFAGQSS